MKGSGSEKKRSESEREKTKMRERKRRAITTNIFRGIRNHGGYPLNNRSDINAVLRHLANEAGFVVDEDGTTYRSNASVKCPLCGSATANLSSMMPNANGTASTTSLPMPGVGDPAPAPAPAPVTTTTAPVSEGPSFERSISVPMYTCQDHVAVHRCGANGGDAVPYYEDMKQQKVEEEEAFFCFEDAANIHNNLVGSMPFF
ncbi:hypothetical protein PIB30_041562 [Stylosanthes scabra]|uniref:Protein BZR1 homolog n=1 Tax=Stylosanthes scabra TaxID=79078 RepID=A0ABU6QFP9_9FABA|nr:hypothetical protein [Stylosanthes scabra]